MTPDEPCVCASGKPFGECCEPFLSYREKPRTVRQLLRARYAAYALGGRLEFLIKTWHPSTARSFSIADLDMNLEWRGLEIVEVSQQGDFGKAEFKARFAEKDGPERIHHEKSVFHRLNGTWLYLEGEIS